MTSIGHLIEARRAEKDDESGFTLIELLIVVVVLGILSAIVVFAVQNLSKESASASCRADAKSMETALEAYKAKNGAYPTTTGTYTPITATVPAGLVGVGNFIRTAPSSPRYQLGLRELVTTATPPVATGVSDGLVYVKAPTATGTVAEFNTGDPCQNAGT